MLAGLAMAVLLAGQATPPRPRADPRLWIQPEDFPVVERPRARNVVGVRLNIDKTGRVAGCMITRSSGYAEFDGITCLRFRMRGRFDPARNAAGRTVEGEVLLSVDWRIPG